MRSRGGRKPKKRWGRQARAASVTPPLETVISEAPPVGPAGPPATMPNVRPTRLGRGGVARPAVLGPEAAIRYDPVTLALGAAVAVTAGVLYVLTAARDIVVGDTAELVTAAITLGVAHAPGYPLLTMLGHMFSLLPLGPLPFRVNLLAAVCDATAVGLVYFTAFHLTRHRVAAGLAALLLAFDPLFWSWSLQTEAFPLNNLLAAALVYLLLWWHEEPRRHRLLVAAAFAGGLGMANHQTIALLAPGILYILWRRRSELMRAPELGLKCIGAVALGLLPYLYVPWASARDPVINWRGVSSFADLAALVTRADYGSGQLVADAPWSAGGSIERFWAVVMSFAPVELLLLGLGAVLVYRLRRWYAWFVGLAVVLPGPAFAVYANIDLGQSTNLFVLERFFLMTHVVLAPLAAFGLLHAYRLAEEWVPQVSDAVLRGAVSAAVGAALLAELVVSYAAIDQSGNHLARTFGEDLLATIEPNGVLLTGTDASVMPSAYLQVVEGYRTDVTLVMLGLLPSDWYVRQLRQRNPDLVVTDPRFDSRTPVKRLIDANLSARRISIHGPNPRIEESLKDNYWYNRRGLVNRIEFMETDVELDDMIADNERLASQYRTPSLSTIKAHSFDRYILAQYALPFSRIGDEYASNGLNAQAKTWYERALSIDPQLGAALGGMAKMTQAESKGS